MELHKKWIEETVKSLEGVEEVVSIKYKSAVGDNENYASAVLKILLEVKMSSGKVVEKSAILKTQSATESAYKGIEEEMIFEVETKVYNDILKGMEMLLNKRESDKEILWPKCYGVKSMTFLMEDLTAAGYELSPKEKPLDSEHAFFLMKQYGKLHGLSMVLLEKEMVDKNFLETHFIYMENSITVKLYQSGMMALANIIEQNWLEEWSDFCTEIRLDIPRIGTKLKELALETKNMLCVFNHGDCWTNNIMFKYQCDSNRRRHLVSLRLIDFQEAHFNSLSWDLTYLLYSCLLSDARDELMTSLLEVYRESLSQTCLSFISDYQSPSIDDINSAMSVMRYYGFLTAITFRPLLIASSNPDYDLDVANLSSHEGDPMCIHNPEFYTEETLKVLKQEIQSYFKHKQKNDCM